MIAHLILLSLYCAVGKTDEDYTTLRINYSDNLKAITKVKAALKANVLSMEGNIPLLDDPRRHYAEIVHVIYQVAKINVGCNPVRYEQLYPKVLSKSTGEALINPQAVIDGVKNFIKLFDESTSEIQTLIEKFHGNDTVINAIVNANPKKYSYPAIIFLIAGRAATEYNLKDDIFNYVSRHLSAQQFLIQGAKEVERVVLPLGMLYRKLHKSTC